MTIDITYWSMTSDITPESAYRITEVRRADSGRGDSSWRLSWLPDRALSAAQARVGMELDEILSDPSVVHDRMAMARAEACADELGITLTHATVLLYKRIVARARTHSGSRRRREAGEPGFADPLTSGARRRYRRVAHATVPHVRE